MPDLVTSIEQLADLDLYKKEKPYCVLVSSEDYLDGVPTDNLKFERHENILVRDIRDHMHKYLLETSGFTVVTHESRVSDFKSLSGLQRYQEETQDVLLDWFQAERVVTWDVKV